MVQLTRKEEEKDRDDDDGGGDDDDDDIQRKGERMKLQFHVNFNPKHLQSVDFVT
jgi:hypothetical protein